MQGETAGRLERQRAGKQRSITIKCYFYYRFAIIGAESPGKRRKARPERAETPTGAGGSFRIGAKRSRPTTPTSTSSHVPVRNFFFGISFLTLFSPVCSSFCFYISFDILDLSVRFSHFKIWLHFSISFYNGEGHISKFCAVRSADNSGEK